MSKKEKTKNSKFSDAAKQGLIWGGAATLGSLLSAKLTGASKGLPTSLIEGSMGAGAGALSTIVGKKDNMSKKASIASKNMYKKLK